MSLFKKRDRFNTNNYRGISLLNTGYKVCTKIINKFITPISKALLIEKSKVDSGKGACELTIFYYKTDYRKKEGIQYANINCFC